MTLIFILNVVLVSFLKKESHFLIKTDQPLRTWIPVSKLGHGNAAWHGNFFNGFLSRTSTAVAPIAKALASRSIAGLTQKYGGAMRSTQNATWTRVRHQKAVESRDAAHLLRAAASKEYSSWPVWDAALNRAFTWISQEIRAVVRSHLPSMCFLASWH